MELVSQEMDIQFERADKGLGLSIAGGLGSTPYRNNDEGIFISRVTPNGPADLAGLRKDDKVISVNGHSCVNIDHYEAVGILKAAGSYIHMKIVRDVFVQKKVKAFQSICAISQDQLNQMDTRYFAFRIIPLAFL